MKALTNNERGYFKVVEYSEGLFTLEFLNHPVIADSACEDLYNEDSAHYIFCEFTESMPVELQDLFAKAEFEGWQYDASEDVFANEISANEYMDNIND